MQWSMEGEGGGKKEVSLLEGHYKKSLALLLLQHSLPALVSGEGRLGAGVQLPHPPFQNPGSPALSTIDINCMQREEFHQTIYVVP